MNKKKRAKTGKILSKIIARIKECRTTQKELSTKLNISEQWLSAKLNGRAIFDLQEMKILIDELQIKDNEIMDFFYH